MAVTSYMVGNGYNDKGYAFVRMTMGYADTWFTPEEAEHLAHLLVTNAEIARILPHPILGAKKS